MFTLLIFMQDNMLFILILLNIMYKLLICITYFIKILKKVKLYKIPIKI